MLHFHNVVSFSRLVFFEILLMLCFSALQGGTRRVLTRASPRRRVSCLVDRGVSTNVIRAEIARAGPDTP